MYYFKKGEKYYHEYLGDKVSCGTLRGVVLSNLCELAGLCAKWHKQRHFLWASVFPPLFIFIFVMTPTPSILSLNGRGIVWDGLGYVQENRLVNIPPYPVSWTFL